ncbi:MAG: GxxExxY protein [Ramlibacter sp.]|jgi:GxxExxY protein|nr:GxxExxY protein [Ramlibacter sp.]MDB5914829.1 GxxExxY protein [Ramlibacter sp.]
MTTLQGSGSNDFSHDIIGAAVEVQRLLGTGLPAAAYVEALALELGEREIGFSQDVPLEAQYKGRSLGVVQRATFIVEQSVLVQVKACDSLTDTHRAEVQAGMRLAGLALGLLINFNVFPVVKGVHRLVNKARADA